MKKGIAPGQALQPRLQAGVKTDSLEIAVHLDGSVGTPGPAQSKAIANLNEEINRCWSGIEPMQHPIDDNLESLKTQCNGQAIEIGVDGRQDGEMGHEPNPALTDTSQHKPDDHAPLRLGLMASGNGSNFEAVARAIEAGSLNAVIKLLVVNNPGCGAQKRAERLGIPCSVVNHRQLTNRESLDRELVRQFQAADVEAIVMAGWMRIVTSVLITGFPDRLVNIHPSLLPSFRGLDAIGQALAAGVKVSGCTVHLVTEELDAGPIVAQSAVPVLPGDDNASLAERIHEQEHRLLPMALTELALRWRQG